MEADAPTLEDVYREVRLLRQSERPIPKDRLYTRAQAGFRIVHGQDPDRIPEGKRKERMRASAKSARWVSDRLADDDCVLNKTMLGGAMRIAERDVQAYLKTERRRSRQRASS